MANSLTGAVERARKLSCRSKSREFGICRVVLLYPTATYHIDECPINPFTWGRTDLRSDTVSGLASRGARDYQMLTVRQGRTLADVPRQPDCGAPWRLRMRCPRCSADNGAGMKFCGEWGALLGSACPSCGAS